MVRFTGKPLQTSAANTGGGVSVRRTTPKQSKLTAFISASKRQDAAWAIWAEWCATTQRPKSDTKHPPGNVLELLAKALKNYQNLDEAMLQHLVRLASLLDPSAEDKHDFMRLVDVFRHATKRQHAERLKTQGSAPILWVCGGESSAVNRVRKFLGFPMPDVLARKELTAIYKLNALDDVALSDCADRAKRIRSASWVMPVEAVTYGLQRTAKEVSELKRKQRDPHSAGKMETDMYASEGTIGYDLFATDMIVDGVPQDEVLAYHRCVPNGFWREVQARVEQPGYGISAASLNRIYAELENVFGGFHPKNRARSTMR